MTDQFPDATKKVLSPAAQAVLDAFGKHPLHSDHITDGLFYGALPAALRAAADEVAPETPESELDDPDMLKGIWSERRTIREELLAIATELEALQ
jgi:hypothetical protein